MSTHVVCTRCRMPVVQTAALTFGGHWIHRPCLHRVIECAELIDRADRMRAKYGGKIEPPTLPATGH